MENDDGSLLKPEPLPEIGQRWPRWNHRVRKSGVNDVVLLADLKAEFEQENNAKQWGMTYPSPGYDTVYVIEGPSELPTDKLKPIGFLVFQAGRNLVLAYVSASKRKQHIATVAIGVLLEHHFADPNAPVVYVQPQTGEGKKVVSKIFLEETEINHASWKKIREIIIVRSHLDPPRK